jgi:exonuclease SbcC
LRGITEAFPNEVCVDFDSLGEGLIAIVGENGAGKSTLIGSVFAALFRQLPGQKRSLYDFATHPQPEIDLTFSVNGARYRSLLKIDPKSRQMESYLFNGDGKPLTNGKKEPFEELVRRCAGTPDFFLSSIFSSQKRTGNFLSLDRSERKELFIRELLGLDRLRLIAAAAKDKGDEVARTTLGLDGQVKSLRELVESRVEDPAEVEAMLEGVSTRLETLEGEKRGAQQRLLGLQATEASRKPLLAEVENLKQRLRKTDAEITEAKRQIGRDESLLAGKKDLADLTERATTLAARIEELHRQIREIQGLETSNRETERTVQALDAELKANLVELDRLRMERAELAIVPCRGEGMVDDFDVEVRNKNLDRTCLVDELSGGQFVLVNEAVNLGIAIYNMRQGEGIRYETLFRDETVGALDAVNGKEYVRMLRRAMDLGGFHQVIFICHTPIVWELADRILSVNSGRVMVGSREASVKNETYL